MHFDMTYKTQSSYMYIVFARRPLTTPLYFLNTHEHACTDARAREEEGLV